LECTLLRVQRIGRGMTHWARARSPLVRVLIYVVAATLAFALAAGVGAMVALTLRGDVGSPERRGPPPADEQRVDRTQQEDGAAEQTVVASRQDQAAADRSVGAAQRAEAEYADAVGDIQTGAVETFLNSHEKLLRYDALAAADVEEMEANVTALQDMADRAVGLDPPRKYGEQHEVFVSAIEELREAAGLAHGMAADPVAVTETAFDGYDGRVDEASALLRRSNDLLGEDYEVPEGVREVSPDL
jgi:hypothetical protein